jgi:hypothetical protein
MGGSGGSCLGLPPNEPESVEHADQPGEQDAAQLRVGGQFEQGGCLTGEAANPGDLVEAPAAGLCPPYAERADRPVRQGYRGGEDGAERRAGEQVAKVWPAVVAADVAG